MKTMLITTALMVFGVMAYASHEAESAGSVPVTGPAEAPAAAIDPPSEVAVGDRYLVPELPVSVVDRLPAVEVKGDRYLTERIALAELVIGERILAAEDLATEYARDRPGFTAVLLADGFRQDVGGTWFYDPYTSWMRFPLNR
jgi:hypothetical protein